MILVDRLLIDRVKLSVTSFQKAISTIYVIGFSCSCSWFL